MQNLNQSGSRGLGDAGSQAWSEADDAQAQSKSTLGESSSLRLLYEIISNPDFDSSTKVVKLLEMGCRQLGLEHGILAKVDDQRYQIIGVYSIDGSITKTSLFLLSQTYCEQTLQSPELFIVTNASQDELAHHPAFHTFGLETYIGVGVKVDGHTYGTINLSSRIPRETPFVEAERTLIRLMAQWIGHELERQRAEDELALRAKELQTLYDTSLDINAQPDLSTLLAAIVQRATILLGTDMGGLSLVRPEEGILEVVAGHNRSDDGMRIPIRLGEGLAGRIALSGEPMIVSDYHHWAGRATLLSDRPIGRMLGVPLMQRQEVVGVLNVFDEMAGDFTKDDIRLLSLFAAQAAVAIENARLSEADHHRAEQLETLRQVSLDLTVSRDLDALLQQIVERAVKLLKGDSGGINLYRPESEILERVAAVGRAANWLGARLVRGEGAAGTVWVTGKPLIVADYQTWAGKSQQVNIAGPTVGTPIQWRNEFLGALIIRRPNEQSPFTTEDADLLSQFATHAAIAIQNAHLYEQAQEEIVERKRAQERIHASLQEKEVLLQEVNHRVKNNLQIISSLLRVQSRSIQDEAVRQVFIESQRRVDAMSLIHERLYKAEDLARIDFATYIKDLATDLVNTYEVSAKITLETNVDPVFLNLQKAIPCGLIINELVTNSLKYAFADNGQGKIWVALKQISENQLMLSVKDNGIGLPTNFNFNQTDSLGLQLVVLLAEQLQGQLSHVAQEGTQFTVVFEFDTTALVAAS